VFKTKVKRGVFMTREYNYDILDLIKERWSPRAFGPEKVDQEDVLATLEAARYAPSCFNEQPWRFILATKPEDLAKMQSILVEDNLTWAKYAPVLMLILAKNVWALNGKDNYWHMFDAGTAWGYLSLEAQRRGLITHAMGGYNRNKARELYSIPEEYSIIAVVAMGKMGNMDNLSQENKEREKPAVRNPLGDIFFTTST